MIEVIDLKKTFNDPPVEVLHGLSFQIQQGTLVSITGKSGSGKSTLLYSMSSLDNPTSGKILFDGIDIASLNNQELHDFRNLKMGFIFQFHYLLPELTALENVLMPARRTHRQDQLKQQALDLLEQFGLKDKEHRRPKELSGGEQQRVAIARALIMKPKYIFADEPTGNLDSQNGQNVLKILKNLVIKDKTTVIYVTHDSDFASMADQKIFLVDGHLKNEIEK